jgi:hypothetical protein
MKKDIFLTVSILLLCLSLVYGLHSRYSASNLRKQLEWQAADIERLKTERARALRVSEKRRARIEQLAGGYPAGIWECDAGAEWIVFKRKLENPTTDAVIAALNEVSRTYNEPGILLLKQDRSDLYLSVGQAEQLTQRMGSAGANCYLGRIVYSLTAIDAVDTIVFDFEEGSHAVPGRYTRNHFEP